MSQWYQYLYLGGCLCLAVVLFFGLLRAIRGPRVADRIMGINIMGTTTILIIAMLALLLDQGWLLDVCVIYAMISFLAVVVLAHIHMAARWDGKDDER